MSLTNWGILNTILNHIQKYSGTITVISHDTDYNEEEPIRRGTNNAHKTQMVFRENQDSWKTVDIVTILDGSNVLLSTDRQQETILDIGEKIPVECQEKQNIYSEQSSLVLERVDQQNRLVHFMLNTEIFPNTSCKDGMGSPQDISIKPVQIPVPSDASCDVQCKNRMESSAGKYSCKETDSENYMCAQASPIQPTILLTSTDETGKQMTFRPTDITVSIGLNNTIRWHNTSYATTISNQEGVYDSRRIPFNDISFQALDKPGKYVFYDESNPDVKANVTVIPLDEKHDVGKPITRYTMFPDVRFQTFRADQDQQNFIHNVSITDSDSVTILIDNTMDSQYSADKNPEIIQSYTMSVGDTITSGCTYHYDAYSRIFYHSLHSINMEGNTAEFKETLDYAQGNMCAEFYSDPKFVSFTLAAKAPESKPPLMQFKSGITIDKIQCRDSLVLVTKYDSSPACVKPDTVSKLAERDWMTGVKQNLQSPVTDIAPIWSYQTDGEISAIRISNDSSLVAVSTNTADRQGMVYLFDKNGSLLWNHTFDIMIGDIVMSSDGSYITVSGFQLGEGRNHVYQNGAVYLLDSDGNLLWENTMNGNNVPWSIGIHPEGSSVLFGTSNKVTSLDKQGNLLWEINAEKYFDSVVFSSDGHFVTSSDSDISFFDSTGKQLWDFTTKYESNYASMVSQDWQNIVISDSSGTDGNIYYLDSDGNLLWEHYLDEAAQHFSMSQDNSYLIASNNWQSMMFDTDGSLLWTNNLPSDVAISSDGSFIAGTTFNQGIGPAITFFDVYGNITSYHPLKNHILFSLSNDDRYLAVADGENMDKISFFKIETLMMNKDKIDLSEMQDSSELHVKVVPQDIPFDIAVGQGQSLQIPWDINIDDGYTMTNFGVSIESSPEIDSWIISHDPYTTINGIPPSDRIITIHPSVDATVGSYTVNIFGEGHSVHNQTGWMTSLENKILGTISVSVKPSDATLSMDIGKPHYEYQQFCVDMASGNGNSCSGGPAYQQVPITVFSENPQAVQLNATISQKGGWIKFIPEKLESGPEGATSEMMMAGYLIPFRSNPQAEQPLIIEATSEDGKTVTETIMVRFGEISVIGDDVSAINLNGIRTNSNGTSFATSGVVYDSFENAEPLSVNLSVLGLWGDGVITGLPSWLSIDIPESSFVLNANVPHHFIIVANTANAPESGIYHIAVNQNIGDESFVELQEIEIRNRR